MPDIKSKRRVLGLALDGPTLWLSYLLLYVWPWVIERPRHSELIASLMAAPVFLFAYYGSFYLRGRAAWPGIAVIAALSIGLGQFTAGASIVMLYAVMVATQSQRGRIRLIWLGGLVAAVVLAAAVGWVSWIYTVGAIFFGALVAAGTAAASLLEDQTEELIRAKAQAEALAVMGERERISRDLHDIVGHSFSTIVLKSDLASRVIDHDPERARRELDDINTVGRDALRDVRLAINGMNQSTLISATSHVRALLEAADIQLSFTHSAGALPAAVEHAAAMILREAVTNVVRHAGASVCTVSLRNEDGALHLHIGDDGRGGQILSGNGLKGIAQRVADLNGTMDISPVEPKGTALDARLPLFGDAP